MTDQEIRDRILTAIDEQQPAPDRFGKHNVILTTPDGDINLWFLNAANVGLIVTRFRLAQAGLRAQQQQRPVSLEWNMYYGVISITIEPGDTIRDASRKLLDASTEYLGSTESRRRQDGQKYIEQTTAAILAEQLDSNDFAATG